MTRVTVVIYFMLTMCLLVQERHVRAFSGNTNYGKREGNGEIKRKEVNPSAGPSWTINSGKREEDVSRNVQTLTGIYRRR